MGPKKFARENADSEIPCITPCGRVTAKHLEQSADFIKPHWKGEVTFHDAGINESNQIKPRNLRVFTANEVPWGAAPSARLYTYGQVTGVHRPRWGPDQRRRCRSQNLQQWAEGTRWKISHWKQKHETREPLDVILSLERLKPPTSTNHMLGVHAAFKALGARVCFPHTWDPGDPWDDKFLGAASESGPNFSLHDLFSRCTLLPCNVFYILSLIPFSTRRKFNPKPSMCWWICVCFGNMNCQSISKCRCHSLSTSRV